MSVNHGQVRRRGWCLEMKVIVKLSRNLDSWQLCTDGHPGAEAAFIPPLEDLTQLCHCMPLTRKCDKSETCVLVHCIVQTLCTYFYLVLLYCLSTNFLEAFHDFFPRSENNDVELLEIFIPEIKDQMYES